MKNKAIKLIKSVLILICLIGIPNIAASTGESKPQLNIDSILYNYGEVIQGEKIAQVINIRNTGKGDLTIESAKPD